MFEIDFQIAAESDNDELLALMAGMPMPGAVQIAYRRDPNFFDALCVEGRSSQTIIGRDVRTGQIGGMGTRSIKPAFVNGEETSIGYLSSLRVLPRYRGTIHLAKGYSVFRGLHSDGQAKLYLSTILNDNAIARKLTTPRRRLPAYHDIGQFRSMAISTAQRVRAVNPDGLTIRHATPEDLPALLKFLGREGRNKQFFPAYCESDFFTDDGLLRGLRCEDILLAFDDDALVGSLAAWDQRAFRQSIITGYTRAIALGRPLYNAYAKLRQLPTLPPAESTLNYCTLSLACIQDDREKIFLPLLRSLMQSNRHYSFMMAGLHESHPFCNTLRQLRHRPYLSRACVVCWDDGEDAFAALDNRTPYLELGGL